MNISKMMKTLNFRSGFNSLASVQSVHEYWLRERKEKPTVIIVPLGRPLMSRRQLLSKANARRKLTMRLKQAEKSKSAEQHSRKPTRKITTSVKKQKGVSKKMTQTKVKNLSQRGIGRLKRQKKSVKSLTKGKPRMTKVNAKTAKTKKVGTSKPRRHATRDAPSTSKHVRFNLTSSRSKPRRSTKSISTSGSTSSLRYSASGYSSSRDTARTARSSAGSSRRSDFSARSTHKTRSIASSSSVGSECGSVLPNANVEVKPDIGDVAQVKEVGEGNNAEQQ